MGLLAGEAGGVRPAATPLDVGNLTVPIGFFEGVALVGVALVAGGKVLLWATLGAAALVSADCLAAEVLLLAVDSGLEASGFLAATAAVVVVAGFLAAAAAEGRLTSDEDKMIFSHFASIQTSCIGFDKTLD